LVSDVPYATALAHRKYCVLLAVLKLNPWPQRTVRQSVAVVGAYCTTHDSMVVLVAGPVLALTTLKSISSVAAKLTEFVVSWNRPVADAPTVNVTAVSTLLFRRVIVSEGFAVFVLALT
jgi:hypothetical protein